jgi:hypothetical protein
VKGSKQYAACPAIYAEEFAYKPLSRNALAFQTGSVDVSLKQSDSSKA